MSTPLTAPTAKADKRGTTLINHWQCGVPVNHGPVFTKTLLLLVVLAALAIVLAGVRFFSPLGPFSGMNDAYAWGIWKTFNVMTLTALGSGPLALGMAAWVFNRQKLHVVMRTALVSGFLFYATGLLALGFDVGRPWNFYSAVLPWRWNSESAMLEISICMPLYCALFLSFEILPLLLERLYYTGNDRGARSAAPRLSCHPQDLSIFYSRRLRHSAHASVFAWWSPTFGWNQDRPDLAIAGDATALLDSSSNVWTGVHDFPIAHCLPALQSSP